MRWLYLLVDIFTVIVPLLFSFHPKIKFYKNWKAFFMANILVASLFLLWDATFTRMQVWSFSSKYVSGIYFFNLPIEEVLFFICVPYACVFTFYCLDTFYTLNWKPKTENLFCLLLSVFLFLLGFLFIDRLYTSVTFISTALVCLFLKFVFKISWFGKSVSVYIFLLLPFFIVNGILTGTGLKQPVVSYNNAENLGIRLLSIPVEDVFYGYELILLNLFFYHLFKNRSVMNDENKKSNIDEGNIDPRTKNKTLAVSKAG